MKWYSIKKYRPCGDYVIVRLVRKSDNDDVVCFATYHSTEEDIDHMFELTCYIDEVLLGEYKVTHFCIPDPVEIED